MLRPAMTTTDSSPRPIWADLTLEAFGYSKVALILTGSAVTQVMPFWIEWAVSAAPETEFKVIMRDSAQRFITRHSIESRLKSRVQADSWGEELIAAHIELAEWADLILVYPATLDYSSRLAHGIADSPSLLAAMTTEAQVCIAPALPPRALENPIVSETLKKLRMPENFLVIDPVPGPSESSDVALAWVPPSFPAVMRRLEEERLLRAGLTKEAATA
ncbi:flavoprotein [Arthrobacter sp. ISL-95]|nr:flavoprotein [Arthrobacter sp. ISL-95]